MTHARLVIAEDYEPTQHALRRIVEPHYEIAAVVADGCSLLEAVEAYRPRLVLLDIVMPVMNGIAAARILRQRHPEIKIIFVSAHSEQAYVDEAFEVGANAYVLKKAIGSELLNAIERSLSERANSRGNVAQ